MKIVMFGTRGSVPVSGEKYNKYGGNTTCLQVESKCLPGNTALLVDAGSGFFAASQMLLSAGVMHLDVLFTHYHYDHTQGILLAPHTYVPTASLTLIGPKEHHKGPKQMMLDVMRQPYHPVDLHRVAGRRMRFQSLEHIGTQVLVVHPEGGYAIFHTDNLAASEAGSAQIKIGKKLYNLSECLVIRMYKTVHPEYTISYRFEERPTGKVFVFLTDHENTDRFPMDLLRHVRGAGLLVEDCQYSRALYDKSTAGFGHATPDYCASLAVRANVQRLGLTHHDPGATDSEVDARLAEAQAWLATNEPSSQLSIFACADYDTYEV